MTGSPTSGPGRPVSSATFEWLPAASLINQPDYSRAPSFFACLKGLEPPGPSANLICVCIPPGMEPKRHQAPRSGDILSYEWHAEWALQRPTTTELPCKQAESRGRLGTNQIGKAADRSIGRQVSEHE